MVELDKEKCNQALEDLLKVFQCHKPTVGEILLIYGNLGYSLGASIGGYDGKGPGVEELHRLYIEKKNRVDVALMLEGLTISSWFESYISQATNEDKDKEEEEDNETNPI